MAEELNGEQYTRRSEGLILWPYDDADPHHREVVAGTVLKGVLTQGYGHTGADIVLGVRWTADAAAAVFDRDYAIAAHGAAADIGREAWPRLDAVRAAVLIDMCFEMGPGRLLGFERMIEAVRRYAWDEAAGECLASRYGAREARRAHRSAWGLHFGVWPPEGMW